MSYTAPAFENANTTTQVVPLALKTTHNGDYR